MESSKYLERKYKNVHSLQTKYEYQSWSWNIKKKYIAATKWINKQTSEQDLYEDKTKRALNYLFDMHSLFQRTRIVLDFLLHCISDKYLVFHVESPISKHSMEQNIKIFIFSFGSAPSILLFILLVCDECRKWIC